MNGPRDQEDTYDIHRLAAAYALDALDANERSGFEAHYPSCADCRSEVLDFRETASQLAEVAAVQPRATMRSDVLSAISQTRQLAPIVAPAAVVTSLDAARQRRRPVYAMLAVAAAVMLLAIGGLTLRNNQSSAPTFADELEQVVANPDSQLLAFDSALSTGGKINIAWSQSASRFALTARGLADPGPGKAYALWLIDADGAQPVGLFTPNADGSANLAADISSAPSTWGVTIEPSTGSPQPTGSILYSAAV